MLPCCRWYLLVTSTNIWRRNSNFGPVNQNVLPLLKERWKKTPAVGASPWAGGQEANLHYLLLLFIRNNHLDHLAEARKPALTGAMAGQGLGPSGSTKGALTPLTFPFLSIIDTVIFLSALLCVLITFSIRHFSGHLDFSISLHSPSSLLGPEQHKHQD